jgi:pimeloyl-ACP methyl ester carboxylesterase
MPNDLKHLRSRRLQVLGIFAGALLLIALIGSVSSASASRKHHARNASAKPTVVFVHGAFADASSWGGTIAELQARGYHVVAPANPLRDVSTDVAYLKSVLATINGPVVLVGHSYGGFVMTGAAYGNPNVKALVYIAAYAPDQGETVGGINALNPGSELTPDKLDIQLVPGADGNPIPEAVVKQSDFGALFAADVPAAQAAVIGASQRPLALATLGEPSGPPAWKTIPSWYMVSGRDKVIGTANEQFMAQRIGAHTVEIPTASHLVMVSHPDAVAKLIVQASNATQ